jgi:biopolymer transport protein ExbD
MAMTFDRLKAELTQRAKDNPRLVVALRADDQAAYGNVVKVTEAAQAAEVKEIRTFLKPGILPE